MSGLHPALCSSGSRCFFVSHSLHHPVFQNKLSTKDASQSLHCSGTSTGFLHFTEAPTKSCSAPSRHRMPPLWAKSQNSAVTGAPLALYPSSFGPLLIHNTSLPTTHSHRHEQCWFFKTCNSAEVIGIWLN